MGNEQDKATDDQTDSTYQTTLWDFVDGASE